MKNSQERDKVSVKFSMQFLEQLLGDIGFIITEGDLTAPENRVLIKAQKIIDKYIDELHGH
jgi:hypothetical protein